MQQLKKLHHENFVMILFKSELQVSLKWFKLYCT